MSEREAARMEPARLAAEKLAPLKGIERKLALVSGLDRCPFCKGQADLEHDDEFAVHRAFCLSCGAFGPFVDDAEPDSDAKAQALWNQRP